MVVKTIKQLALEEGERNAWGILLVKQDTLRRLIQRLYEDHEHLDILEIGCYKGMLVGWLKHYFPEEHYSWSYVGVDIVEPIDRRKDYPHYIMNAEALEFPSNSFDLVVMIEVLEHIVDYVKALYEVYRVLRFNGALFIQSVICYDKCALSDKTHFHVLHPVTLKRLLEHIGFRGVEYEEGGNFTVIGYKR